MPSRVLPTDKIRAEIDGLFGSGRDLAEITPCCSLPMYDYGAFMGLIEAASLEPSPTSRSAT